MFPSRIIVTLFVLISSLDNLALARPARGSKPILDDLPKLSDTLSVAKSPLEPPTPEPEVPDGWNSGHVASETTTTVSSSELPARERVTTLEPDEQDRDLTTLSETTTAENLPETTTTAAPIISTTIAANPTTRASEVPPTPEASTEAETTTSEPDLETTTNVVPAVAKENPITESTVSTASTQKPLDASTTSNEVITEIQPTEEPETSSVEDDKRLVGGVKTTATSSSTTSTTTASPESEVNSNEDSAIREVSGPSTTEVKVTTAAEPPTELPTSSADSTIQSEQESKPVNELPPNQVSTLSSTTSSELAESSTGAPTTTEPSKVQPEEETNASSGDQLPSQPTTEAKVTTTPEPPAETTTAATRVQNPIVSATTGAPEEVKPSDNASTTTTPEPTSPSTSASTTLKPAEVAKSTTLAPASSTSAATTGAPGEKEEEANKRVKDDDKPQACNHLPTYDADEIQKVFREETTYKNGTIKGKFTYVNFDQRYRLVHYTRLPYGPVKIDQVEELGRADNNNNNNNNQSYSPGSIDDIPETVLQLRHILPNSLFGFPFLGRSSPQGKTAAAAQRESTGDGHEHDRSNMYFYSTDTISTPNLLTPSVPVSVLPSQRKPLEPLATPQGFYSSSPQAAAVASAERKSAQDAPHSEVAAPYQPLPHFQYASHQQQIASLASEAKAPAPTYSYQNQAHQYQYSPVPLYSFQQPAYYSPSLRQQVGVPVSSQSASLSKQHRPEQSAPAPITESSSFSITHHQTHQPHSHEHYIAPFMFSQSPGLHVNDQTEASKLKLRVKTSKSLSHEPVGKSAQLRVAPSSSAYSSPINSPVQVRRMQQQQQATSRTRLGKQNQELKTQTVNQTPVVYHVLRSPVGRMYTLPQYNQAHAMAYDHDED